MFYVYVLIAKLCFYLIKLFHFGTGYTWPGHIVLKLNSKILSSKSIKFKYGIILISGTNGKTTTATLLKHILESSGLVVTHNKTGANILNGIVSAILLNFNVLGKSKADVAVLEVDEFTLPYVLSYMSPSVLLLLNLSRDQLDRYGEVDIIFDKWKQSVHDLASSTVLVLDSEQDIFKELSGIFGGRIFYFNSDHTFLDKANLHGHFNAKNINAALVTSSILGLDKLTVGKAIGTFEAAYGRGEAINYEDKHLTLFLAKNPASFNNNLDLLISNSLNYDSILFLLNDEIRDGRDVSWIYDIVPEKLASACMNKHVFVSGSRYLDMAIRLQYSGVALNKDNVFPTVEQALKKMTENLFINDVIVLPNYSSMLGLREFVLGRKIL